MLDVDEIEPTNDDVAIKELERYLNWFSGYFKENPPDINTISEMFDQIQDVGNAIKVLLKENHTGQCLVLNRTLGEISILIFVVCSLKEKSRDAYLAVYELHGYFELLEIFEKYDFKKHREEQNYLKKLTDRMEELKRIITEEFAEPNEKVDDKKLKSFVRLKLSSYIFKDAEIISNDRYKEFSIIQKSVGKILKNSGSYQTESNYTHGRYLASLLIKPEIKMEIIKDVINRMHLAMTIYAMSKDVKVPNIGEFLKS